MKREQAILSPCMLEGNTEPVKGARAGSEFLVTSYKFSPLCFLGMGHFYPRFNSISHFPPLIRQLSPWSNSTLTVKVYSARQFGSCSKAKKGKQINHTSKNFQELPPVLQKNTCFSCQIKVNNLQLWLVRCCWGRQCIILLPNLDLFSRSSISGSSLSQGGASRRRKPA